MPGAPSLADAAAHAATPLEAAGFDPDDSRRETAVLARWLLGWTEAEWLSRLRDPAPADLAARLAPLVARRARHEPVAYITGRREFYGRPFLVTPDVLIPRPETELVVEEALTCLHAGPPGAGRVDLLDVGTGSGCLAVTLALEWPPAHVTATDVSPAALDVARQNARRFGVADRVAFRQGPMAAGLSGRVDLVVANPPYVPDGDLPGLSADVADYEPPGALFAGPDGLDVIRGLVPEAARLLAPGGWLVLEIGQGQEPAVRRLVNAARPLSVVRVRADLQRIPRVVVARAESL
jgi:release factor glutamine methyltransferase